MRQGLVAAHRAVRAGLWPASPSCCSLDSGCVPREFFSRRQSLLCGQMGYWGIFQTFFIILWTRIERKTKCPQGQGVFSTNSVFMRYFKISLAYLPSNIKGLFKLEGETRYVDCLVWSETPKKQLRYDGMILFTADPVMKVPESRERKHGRSPFVCHD